MAFSQAATGGVRQLKMMILSRDRSLPHFERKFYHMLMGLMCFGLYAFVLTREQSLWILGGVGGLWVALDLARLHSPSMNELTLKLFGKVMRREELKSVSGNSFYIAGMFFIVLFFPRPIVMLSVLYLALGDPTAAIVGTLFGRRKLVGRKSLEGALANWLVSAATTGIVALGLFGLSTDKALLLAAVGGTVSMLAELCPLPVDDNFSIPVVSASLLALAFAFLPILP